MRKAFYCFILASFFLGAVAMADEALHNPQKDYPGSPEKPLTQELIHHLSSLNQDGQIYEAWKLLADQKDGYARSAVRIFGKKTTLQKCVVESNWKVVVGNEVRVQLFQKYAQTFQGHYIQFLNEKHRYPNTNDIEILYQTSNSELNLPQRISVDLLFNTVPEDWQLREFFDGLAEVIRVAHRADKTKWYHYVKISPARYSNQLLKLSEEPMDLLKENYKKTTKEITRCMMKKLVPQLKHSENGV